MSQFKQPFNQEPSQQAPLPQWAHPQFYKRAQPTLPSTPAIRPPQRKSNMQRQERRETIIAVSIVLVVIAVIVLASVIFGFVSSNSSSHISTGNGTSDSVVTWTTTHTFTGNGDKKTEIFSVPDDWMILWSCQGLTDGSHIDGRLYVNIYGSNGQLIDLEAVSGTCVYGQVNNDNTEEHQGGNVYLEILTSLSWTIRIQELR